MVKQSKVAELSGWKPVELDGAVFNNDIGGLICIEELTDYDLEKGTKKIKVRAEKNNKKQKKKATKKRKHSDIEENVNDENRTPLVKIKKIKNAITKELDDTSDNITESSNSVEAESDVENDIIDDTVKSKINYAAWSVLGVPNVIMRALADQNFSVPTTIQALTLAPAILGHRDILGAAETGSGKTLAFGIPIINGILEIKKNQKSEGEDDILSNDFDNDDSMEVESDNELDNEDEEILENEISEEQENYTDEEEEENTGDEDCENVETDLEDDELRCVSVIDDVEFDSNSKSKPSKPLYALILTPTRELAMQIKDHLTKAAKYTDIKIAVLVGGMASVKQERILSKGPEIVIATPGRLWELIEQGNLHLSQVDSIKFLAIDETDRMLEKGHFQELHTLIEKINANETKIKQRQNFVFSATLTMVHDIPDYLKMKKTKFARSKIFKLTPGQKLQKIIEMLKMKKPKIVDVTKGLGTAEGLTECRIACTIDHKDYYLYYFLKKHCGRTLIFCNSIGCVKRLATLFSILDCNPLPLHANMQQRQRLKNLERFQADENGILIATDVAARGLDIPNVEHVIHYQVPRTSEGYVHRSGRTARATKEGITVLMMEPSEKENYIKLCKNLGRTHDLPNFPVVDRLLVAVKERVNLARDIDKLDLKCRRDNVHKGWVRKVAEEMDILVDEDQADGTMEEGESANLRRQLKAKRQHLSKLLSKPVFPKGFSGKYPELNANMNLVQQPEKAVDLMKRVIEENPKQKKKNVTPVPQKKKRASFAARRKNKNKKTNKK